MSAARSTSSRGAFARAGTSRASDAEQDAPTRRARRSTPVRVTVDLTPEDHRALTRLTGELAEALDVARLSQAQVWRALLAELDDNPRLLSAVRARLAEKVD